MRLPRATTGFRAILALLALVTTSTGASADKIWKGIRIGDDVSAPMTFRLGTGLVDTGTVWAVGEILPETDKTFQSFLESNKLAIRPGTTIVFHSPGGNPDAGMAVGRMIRAHSMRTKIGQSSRQPGTFPGTIEPGVCASSCAFAFLGGVERRVPTGSLYGVHDINLGDATPDKNSLPLGQLLGAQFTDYMNEMNVDTKLAVLASSYDSKEGQTYYLTPAEMAALRVTTGVTTAWGIEQVHGDFTLSGRNNSQIPSQTNDLAFWCIRQPSPTLLLGINYVPDWNIMFQRPWKPAEYAADITSIRLVADPPATGTAGDTSKPPLDIAPADISEALHATGTVHVSAFIKATPRILNYLNDSKVVRIAFRDGLVEPDNGSFDTDIAEGRAKISEFAGSCK